MRPIPVVLAAIVAALGVGVATVVADTTGAVSVCATSPAQTLSDNGSPVATVPAATSCATTTYTVPTVTQTVTQTVTTPPTTTATTTTTPTTGGTPGVGVLSYGGHLSTFANINQYAYVIGSSYSSSDTTVLKAAAGRSLTYFDGMDVATTYSTGVTYTQALNNGWLLKNSAGAYLVNSTYGTYCADVGSAAYTQAWISNVLAYLAARPGIDGVFIDNTLSDPKAECGGYPAKYPTTADYSAAMLSFVKAAYAGLHAKGYYVALNANGYIAGDSNSDSGTNTVTWWKEVGPYADGLMNEYYDETSAKQLRAMGAAWYQHFDGWQRLIPTAQSMGDDFLGLTKSASCTDTVTMTYGKASFLLEWDGAGGAFLFTCGAATDPGNAVWTTDLGTPTGAKAAVGVGWERTYTKGTVLVNPSPSSSQTFTVNGTSITLAPTTAKILAG